MKKIVSFLLTITLLLCNGFTVSAEEIPTPPADQISFNPNYAFDENYYFFDPNQNNPNSSGGDGLGLIYIYSGIRKSGSNITASFTTTANLECTYIGAAVIIQRWNNNSWETVYSFSVWDYDVSSVSATKTINVDSGFYYRVRAMHVAATLLSSKSGVTVTQSILVN